MSEKKPNALRAVGAPGLCPVCGKASYSQTGTHPQCALARFDAADKAQRKASADVAVRPDRKSWFKTCPKCTRQIPARRAVCECGHSFLAGAGPVLARKPLEKSSPKLRKPR